MFPWAILIFSVSLAGTIAFDFDFSHAGFVEVCLQDELCARRLSDALPSGGANSSNGTAPSAPAPPFDLSRPSWNVTELGVPASPIAINGDIILGAFAAVHGLWAYDPSISLEPFPSFQWPLMIKVALIAFANGLIFDRPPVMANHSFQILFIDQCKEPVTRYEGEKCQVPYNIKAMQPLFFEGPDFPRARATIGGTQFTEKLAHLGAFYDQPMIGFFQSEDALSDKASYPTFLRVNQPNKLMFRVIGDIVTELGFTIIDQFWCETDRAPGLIAISTEYYTSLGFKTSSVVIKKFQYTASPAGSPADQKFLEIMGSPEESAVKKAHFDLISAAALTFNAHVHQNTVNSECAFLDVHHELELHGLVGRGHFWLGWPPAYAIYEGTYQLAMTVTIPAMTGYTSDFIYGKPYDGGLWMDVFGSTDSPKMQDFKKIMAYVGQHQEEFLDPWLVNKFPAEAFSNTDSGLWRFYLGVDLVDAVLSAIYAANSCLIKYGFDFTDAQMMEELKGLDFEGLGKRIRFDENLDPISQIVFQNYRYPLGWEKNSLGDPLGELVTAGHFETEVVWTDRIVFFDGLLEPPPNEDTKCPLGMMYERVSGSCLECPPGTYTARQGMAFCELCSPGTYTDQNQTATCKPCMEGTFAALPGATGCGACAAGTYNDGVQQAECKECSVGSYSADGAKLCTLCDRGDFATNKGSSRCSSCPAQLTTLQVGTVEQSGCVCPEGTYRDADSRQCTPCPTGMTCAIGSDEQHLQFWLGGRRLAACASKEECPIPVTLPGYMSRTVEPLRPFKCLSEDLCPGGPPGTCGDHVDTATVACASCTDDARKGGDGCVPCHGASDSLPFVFTPIVVIIFLVVFVWAVNRDKMMESKVALSFGLILTIAISSLQTMSMFGSLNVDWFPPLKGVIEGLGFLQFNPEFLKPSCAVKMSPVLLFLGRQLIPLFLCTAVLCIVLVERVCWRGKIDAYVNFTNSVGVIFVGLFISMISNSFTPFVCYQHPDGSWSLLTDPAVLCWQDDEHTLMVILALILFLAVPVPYVSIVTWATARYSRFVEEGADGDNRHLLAFRFLFHRFHPRAYYYNCVCMLRALLICLTPVAVAKDPVFQLCILAFIIIGIGMVANRLQPWKASSANFAEAAMNALLVLLIVCGAADADLKPHESSIQAFTLFLLFLGGAMFCTILINSAIRFVRPPVKFDVAVCCSVADAGAQGRLLKTLMTLQGFKVCLSSDLGHDADVIFDLLKKGTNGLAVFLTRTCLTKPLVAGQIALSFRAKLKIVAYRAASFVPPLAEDLENLPGYLEISGISLGQAGIDWSAVKVAYSHLLESADTLDLSTLPQEWLPRFTQIAARFCAVRTSEERRAPEQGMVMISCDGADENAIAVAGIVTCKLHTLLPNEVTFENTLTVLKDTGNTLELVNLSRSIIVILSPNSLHRRLQLQIIQLGMARLVKGGGQPHRQRSQFRKEARKSSQDIDVQKRCLAMCPCGERKAAAPRRSGFRPSMRTSADFEMIPVTTEGFHFPSHESFEVLYPGLAGGKLDDIQAFFDYMPCQLSVDADDRLLRRQIEAIACLVPSPHEAKTASFVATIEDEIATKGDNSSIEPHTKTVYI